MLVGEKAVRGTPPKESASLLYSHMHTILYQYTRYYRGGGRPPPLLFTRSSILDPLYQDSLLLCLRPAARRGNSFRATLPTVCVLSRPPHPVPLTSIRLPAPTCHVHQCSSYTLCLLLLFACLYASSSRVALVSSPLS